MTNSTKSATYIWTNSNKTYFAVEKAEDKRYYITSNNGYNGYEGQGHATKKEAMKWANTLRKEQEYDDRQNENVN